MQTAESRIASYLVFLRFFNWLTKLIFPVFSELQWIIVAAVLLYETVLNYEYVWQVASASPVAMIYTGILVLAAFWQLYVEVVRHKKLSTGNKYIIATIYYTFFAACALLALSNDHLPRGSWWETVNYALATGVLILSVIRGVIVLIAFRFDSKFIEAIIADRMSDQQYSPIILLAVGTLAAGMFFIFSVRYGGHAAPVLLSVIYTGIIARAIEFALPHRA